MTAASPLRDRLGDRYSVGRRLGAGGNGVVWQARDGVLDRDVALKVVNNAEHARLSREARTAARVNHPNVVAVYDAGQDQEVPRAVAQLETVLHRKPDVEEVALEQGALEQLKGLLGT